MTDLLSLICQIFVVPVEASASGLILEAIFN